MTELAGKAASPMDAASVDGPQEARLPADVRVDRQVIYRVRCLRCGWIDRGCDEADALRMREHHVQRHRTLDLEAIDA